jgi:hypothetical protein
MAKVLDIEISHVQNIIFETVWAEEEGKAPVSFLVLTVILYRIPENMTGTDKDNTEIDSRLLVSFYCENNVVPHLYISNYRIMEKFGKQYRLLVE